MYSFLKCEEKEEKEEEEERRRKAPAHKLMGWFKNLGKAIVTGDGEE